MVFKSLISLYLVVLLTSIGYLSKCVNAFRLQIAFKSQFEITVGIIVQIITGSLKSAVNIFYILPPHSQAPK